MSYNLAVRRLLRLACLLFAFGLTAGLRAQPVPHIQPPQPQQSAPGEAKSNSAPAVPGATHPSSSKDKTKDKDQAAKDREAEAELQRVVSAAGNDHAALVRGLQLYLQHYPDAPRKTAVYRALMESCNQLHDYDCALDSAERLIAVTPDDWQTMMLAVGFLETKGDDHSLLKAVGYISRVIDRVEKMSPAEKPARLSFAEWAADRAKIRVAVYVVRGRLEFAQHSYDLAAKDLQRSYDLQPNAAAAAQLAELAELRKNWDQAAARYLQAFVLPENGPGGNVDHRDIRRKLGNVWRELHGSETGLGDAILKTYDQVMLPARNSTSPSNPPAANPAARNKNAHDPFAFVLRSLDGDALPLAPFKGKVVVLNFWATWCSACRELDPLFVQVAQSFQAKPGALFFAVNTDDDESRVASFVTREKMNSRAVPVVFADGLDVFLGVGTLPTVLVLDHSGKIVYRVDGFDARTFVDSLSGAIGRALAPPS